jgi:hypothetical protein
MDRVRCSDRCQTSTTSSDTEGGVAPTDSGAPDEWNPTRRSGLLTSSGPG